MNLDLIGDLIDKLTIINIKIWDATQKAHLFFERDQQEEANELFRKVELMNVQRKEYISAINRFFTKHVDFLNQKSFNKKLTTK